MNTIRILLVDDQKMVREALKVALQPEEDINIVGTANNGLAAIQLVEQLNPDLVVMNMEMPGLDGATATQEISRKFSNTKVVILSSYDTDEYITKSLAMGAKGYLLKDSGIQDIAGVIRNVNKGYTQISPGLLEKLLIYTDSGVVLNKFQGTIQQRSRPMSRSRQTPFQPQKTLSSLQLISRQQQEEIGNLRSKLQNNQQELPKIKKSIAGINKFLWVTILTWLISLPFIILSLYFLYNKTNNIQAAMIPNERIGINGEFSLSGIAERVAKEFQKDPVLGEISTVYVAQEDDAIILKGKISNRDILRRMENLAMEVQGVKKVYSSQVAIESKVQKELLGVQK